MRAERTNSNITICQHIRQVRDAFGNSSDLLIREILLGGAEIPAAILFIEETVDSDFVQATILDPMMDRTYESWPHPEDLLLYLSSSVIRTKAVSHIHGLPAMEEALLSGKTLILIEGTATCLAADTTKWNGRSISNPTGQRVLKGPDVGFTENRSSNVSLVRKILKTKDLRVTTERHGINTQTDISLIYIDGIVDQEILKEIQKRLSNIHLDAVLETNYIEEMLTKDSKSPFPLMLNTDRPDVVAAEILEGKVGILVDGSPYALVAPAVFIQFFQSPDDYYFNEHSTRSTRLTRLSLFVLSAYLPGVYVAFTSYHADFLPVQLMLGFVTQRENVPLPTYVEAVLVYYIIQAVFESSIRLPQTVILTVSVFAAITIGQSAVEAQLVQPITLVVLSASSILSGVVSIPEMRLSFRYITFIMILLGAFLGLYGIALCTLVLTVHLCSLRSFGVPYLAPFAPFVANDQKDGIYRFSLEEITNDESNFSKEETMEKTERES